MLTTWLYASISTLDRAEARDAVRSIVDVSSPKNSLLKVTGALIWSGRRFAQFLEGPHDSVATLRVSISNDPRHREIETLEALQPATRIFEGWALAYSDTTSFVERELDRICNQAPTNSDESARDLKALLLEFVRSR